MHQPPWPVLCHDCDNRWIAVPIPEGLVPGCCWRIEDRRAAQVARTGPLSAWLTRVTLRHHVRRTALGGAGDFGDDLGLVLVLVAHHHRRGQRLHLTEQLWQQAVTLSALASRPGRFDGPWAGARLLLDATTSIAPPPHRLAGS